MIITVTVTDVDDILPTCILSSDSVVLYDDVIPTEVRIFPVIKYVCDMSLNGNTLCVIVWENEQTTATVTLW